MKEPANFGAALRAFRLAAGLTQGALAERARVSTEAISALERGFRRRPHADTVALLATALGLDDELRTVLERAAAHPSPGLTQTNDAIPSYPHRLIGRAGETEAILSAVQAGSVVSLVGPGGVGKSRLAAEIARRISEEKPAFTVGFVDLASLERTDPLPSKLAASLGVVVSPGRKTIDSLTTFLRARRTVLVLDNCEHVTDVVGTLLTLLLRDCRDLAVIVTSRQPLGLAAETVQRVPPLAVPPESTTPILAEVAERYAAIALFCERAAQAGRSLTPASGEVDAIAEICRRLDGLPLAIELAAARLRTLGVADLRRRLDERFAILTTHVRDVLPRHRTLRATIDWSYALLAERERSFLRAAGIFPEGFTLDAAQAVCDASRSELGTLEVVTALVDRSLLQPNFETEETRYRLLETTRAYAAEQLDACDERNEVMHRLIRYLTDAVGNCRVGKGGAYGDLSRFLRAERSAVTSALRWGLSGSETVAVGELLDVIGDAWSFAGQTGEGVKWIEAYDRALPDDAALMRGSLNTSLTHLYANDGRDRRALQAAERAVAFTRDSDAVTRVQALRSLAISLARVHKPDEAQASLEEAEALAGSQPQVRLRRALINARGMLAMMRSDYGTAEEAFRANIAISRELGDRDGEMHETLFLAQALHAAGDNEGAMRDVESVLQRGRAMLSRDARSALLVNLAGYRLTAGDLGGGAAAAREALSLAAQAPLVEFIFSAAVQQFALAVALRGELRMATRLLGYSIAAQKAAGFETSPVEVESHDRILAIVRDALPAQRVESELSEGAGLTIPEVLQLVEEHERGLARLGSEHPSLAGGASE